MKILTLWNPWANAIAANFKRVETRRWATSYRGPLLIHSANRVPKEAEIKHLRELPAAPAHLDALISQGLGCVTSLVTLVDCVEMTPDFIAQQTETELAWGDWREGRFAWMLDDIQALLNPVVWKGQQGLKPAPLELIETVKQANPELIWPDGAQSKKEAKMERTIGSKLHQANIRLGKLSKFWDPQEWQFRDLDELHSVHANFELRLCIPNGGYIGVSIWDLDRHLGWCLHTELMPEHTACWYSDKERHVVLGMNAIIKLRSLFKPKRTGGPKPLKPSPGQLSLLDLQPLPEAESEAPIFQPQPEVSTSA